MISRSSGDRRFASGDSSVLVLLQARLENLSRNQKSVARFLLSHLDEAVFLTAAELAKRSRTSESTVIRLARTLGYQGYPELREHMQEIVRQSFGPTERLQRVEKLAQQGETILDQVTEAAFANIREMRRSLDPGKLEEAAKALVSAESKYVVGLRASSGVAKLLGFYFNQILPRVHVLTEEASALFEGLASLEKNDAVLAISYARYTRWTVECLRYARDRGATTITITDSLLSPTAQLADITLLAKWQSITFNNSYVTATLIVDALIAMVLSLTPEKSQGRLEARERGWRGLDFFYSSTESKGSEAT